MYRWIARFERLNHLPSVAFFGCAELRIVLLEGHFLPLLCLEVQNEEIRIAIGVFAVCPQPCDDGEMFLRMGLPCLPGRCFAVREMDIAAY